MAASAGFNATIEVSVDDSTYNDIGIANTVSGNLRAAMLGSPALATAPSSASGLFDTPATVSGHYDDGDTGQAAIRRAPTGRTQLICAYLPDGTNGFKIAAVENYEFGSGVSDTNTFSVSLPKRRGAHLIRPQELHHGSDSWL